jgi:esterase/lipase
MHRHSAWTILGVDPATQRAAEELAAHEGLSVGGLLQVLLAEHASARRLRHDSSAVRQRLVPLFQDIVDAIGTAARVLAEGQAPTFAGSAEPLREEPESEAPSFQEIQDWLRRVDAKKADSRSESKVAEFGRALLRRAG